MAFRGRGVLVGCVAGVLLQTSSAPVAARTDQVRIDVDEIAVGQPVTTVANGGTAATTQTVVRAHGGVVSAVSAMPGHGTALRLPAYRTTKPNPRAVLAVTTSGTVDALNPGAAPFTFGASATLDSANRGTSADNGNNLVQRGLHDGSAQYKLQVDGRYYSCHVRGDDGDLFVRSTLQITHGAWYQVSCRRDVLATGDRIAITVTRVLADGTLGATRTTTSSVGPVGHLTFAPDVPLTVGGKLIDLTTFVASSDQFNGKVDAAFLRY